MADIIDQIINSEGGDKVTNDPSDSGHLTKWGIAQSAHPDVDILHLTYEGARAIYIDTYLTKSGIAKLEPEFLRNQVLDFAVNAGVERAINTLQGILGVARDGVIGPATLAALAARDAKAVNNLYVTARRQFYYHLAETRPKDKKYLKGWLRRAQGFYLP